MSFVNGEEFAAFCFLHAYKTGYQLIIRNNSLYKVYKDKGVKRNGVGDKEAKFYMMTRIRFICNKGSPPKGSNLEKCLVVIDARINSNECIVITQCNLEHKHHEVDPGNSRLMVGFRLMPEYFKRRAM